MNAKKANKLAGAATWKEYPAILEAITEAALLGRTEVLIQHYLNRRLEGLLVDEGYSVEKITYRGAAAAKVSWKE